MNLVTITQFKNLCGCSYEAIRQRIESGTITTVTTKPTVIDADDYADLIQLIKLRVSSLAQRQGIKK